MVTNIWFDTWSFGEVSRLILTHPKEVHHRWLHGELPKRARLIRALLSEIHCSYIDRITVFVGVSKKDDYPLYRVVSFSRKLDLISPKDIAILKNIFLKITLDSVCSVDSFTKDSWRRAAVSHRFRKDDVFKRGIYFADIFNPDKDADQIIQHLGGDIHRDITKSLNAEVDSFFERFFWHKDKGFSHNELIQLHDKANAWARKRKLNITDDGFADALDLCLAQLCEDCDFLDETIKEDWLGENMSVWFVAAHALCQTQRIKLAQRVKNSDEKKAKAFKLWKKHYQDKTKESRKRSRVSQRSIAKDVGVSVGTLNNWFKKFNKLSENKGINLVNGIHGVNAINGGNFGFLVRCSD